MASEQDKNQIEQLQEAEKLAFDHPEFFEQVLDTTISICLATPLNDFKLQFQCLNFIYKAFHQKKIESSSIRIQQSAKLIDLLDYFIIRNEEKSPNYMIIQKCIDILTASYDLIFLNMINSPDESEWDRLTNIKEYLLSQLTSSYPLQPYNPESDLFRSIGCKNSIIKLTGKVIQVQLPSTSSSEKIEDDISVSMIGSTHPFLLNANLSSQAQNLLDSLFVLINEDIILPTGVFTTIMSTLMTLFKTRSKFVSNKFIMFVLAYESQLKLDPRFEKDQKLKMKLIKRFNDRIDKCLISFLLNKGFLAKDPGLKTRFENKFNYLVEKSRKQRQGGIIDVDIDDDDDEVKEIKRQKLEAIQQNDMMFYNESRIARSNDYKAIYTLIKPEDQLTGFEMSSIPVQILSSMVIAALSKVTTPKLIKGLNIVSDRYKELTSNTDSAFEGEYLPADKNLKRKREDNDDDDGQAHSRVKYEGENGGGNDVDGINDDDELKGEFVVPLPDEFSISRKKDQLKLIIDNFINLSAKKIKQSKSSSDNAGQQQMALQRVAIPNWDKDSWIKLLSRLATRGLGNKDLSDCVRETLFNYLKDDVKNRIDGVIEWLNEEYFSEIQAKSEPIPSPDGYYMKYAGYFLDNLIPFLESADRKIFIRLLSELPYLQNTLIWKIKSLCKDPVRSKLGFQSLLYLIMFRPPVVKDCLDLIKEMHDDPSSDDALQQECSNYLKKYSPK
ncbi:hypothetical protein OGAPHI_002282 [Ogataea philodendri]|uniref:Symplekin/Pta1 N-terminal domain-containing protein n=2 Tax=Ogataea TaxID=461281 RepID=A0A9P8PA76_9ASCO|nr:uncharacterized protein OGAPHI_002282 [Ogataea philodendri]KAH3668528.1 hypothetical protein OGAPHI_002282 [Ogataea philodendri]